MSPRSNRELALGQRSTLIKHMARYWPADNLIWQFSIGHNMMSYIKNFTVKQGCMSLSTYYLEDGCHLVRLHRRRRRRRRRHHRRAYASTSNTASHDNHEKISSRSRVSFSFLYGYGAPLGGPSGRRSSAIRTVVDSIRNCSVCMWTRRWGGGGYSYQGLMGTYGQPGYVYRDFCLKQGIDLINFCLKQGIFSFFFYSRC